MYHLRCRIWRWISDRRSVPYLLHVSIRIWDLERRSGRTLGPVWDPTVGVSRRHESRRTRTFQSSHFARDIRSTASERPSWRQEHRSRTQNAPREWGVFFVFFLRTQINQRSRSNLRTRSARAQQLAPMHTQPSHVRRHAASRTIIFRISSLPMLPESIVTLPALVRAQGARRLTPPYPRAPPPLYAGCATTFSAGALLVANLMIVSATYAGFSSAGACCALGMSSTPTQLGRCSWYL